jgi:hypothetical protein
MHGLKLAVVVCLMAALGSGGAVTAQDVAFAADGGCTALSGYQSDCDVNRDEIINTLDLQLVAFHFGETGTWSGGTSGAWSLSGNAGTSPSTDFIGTTDATGLTVRVDNQLALRIEPATNPALGFSPNLIGGYSGNAVAAGTIGAVVGGGGRSGGVNEITASFATISGGEANRASNRGATVGGGNANLASGDKSTVAGGSNNQALAKLATVGGGITNIASGEHATVPGGLSNTAAGDYSLAAGRRAKADHAGAFVWADATDADFHSNAANEFLVRASGGARIYTNSSATGGANLPAGSGSWSSFSDRNAKADFAATDREDVLSRLAGVPIQTWRYRSQDASIRHMGPMAQDFYAAFGLGEDDRYISTVDADGVALAAIQGLYELVQAQQARIDSLAADNAALRLTNAELASRVSALEDANGR